MRNRTMTYPETTCKILNMIAFSIHSMPFISSKLQECLVQLLILVCNSYHCRTTPKRPCILWPNAISDACSHLKKHHNIVTIVSVICISSEVNAPFLQCSSLKKRQRHILGIHSVRHSQFAKTMKWKLKFIAVLNDRSANSEFANKASTIKAEYSNEATLDDKAILH
ncbi:hypothetical protein Tsp_11909 [Trichinella spiralis]|uniref:hypothetical protein n=1 Tax=Trichinella spiralis TaxID=6334 RepID=UPI0001EFD381|nr:hypothetical protein Tsp_11909 [Trichinella spiralis]